MRLASNAGTVAMLPVNASGGVRPSGRGVQRRPGRAEYNAAVRVRSRRAPLRAGWADGSRRPVGPLGGPTCARQTGYRSVLY